MDLPALSAGVAAARAAGLIPCVHAIGDAAVRRVIDALSAPEAEATATDDGNAEVVPSTSPSVLGRIEHCQHIHPADVERLAAINKQQPQQQTLWASVQPLHMEGDAAPAERNLGTWRRFDAFPLHAMHRRGIPIALGSDWPVVAPDPVLAVSYATDRTALPSAVSPPEGHARGAGDGVAQSTLLPWGQSQALTMAAAMAMHTAAPPESCGADATLLGKLLVGYAADVVLLLPQASSRRPFEIGATILNGRLVYQR
jgi:predicted amidohydrolase YtcJ